MFLFGAKQLCFAIRYLSGPPAPDPGFDCSVPAHGTDALRFAYRRAGGGETFFSRIGAILFGGSWAFPAQTRAYFSLVGKVGKSTHRGGTLSMGSLPYVPHPRDTPSAAPPGAATEPPPHRPPNQTGRGRGNGPPSGPQVKRRRGGRPRRGPRGPGRRPGQGPEPERRPPQGRPRRPPLPCQTRPRRA